ncbi:MAG: hypothetical protein M1833_001392 [Piccolia ochrophora]|nr:MAG: hypothetical protein M1833_001392 [Piccolia ochrophora]
MAGDADLITPAADTTTENTLPKPVTICVFCGSRPGISPGYLAAARSLAEVFHRHSIRLVYGGGTVGLMGELARTLVSLSGPQAVHGIIPKALVEYERGAPEAFASGAQPSESGVPDETVFGRTTVVPDMHTRKRLMAQEVIAGGLGGGFVALPGGYGTLEELMEVVTWNQLGIHGRGIVAYNVEGYWDGVMDWVKGAVTAGFVGEGAAGILVEAKDAEDVVTKLRDYQNAEGRLRLNWEKSDSNEVGGKLQFA